MLHFWFFCRVFPSHTRRTRPLRMRERANWREIAPSCHDSAAVEWHFPVKSGNLVKPGQSNSHATTLAARGSPTGGRTTIGWPRRVCTAAVSALPQSRELPPLSATCGTRTVRKRQSGGGRLSTRDTPPHRVCSERRAPPLPGPPFPAASGEPECNQSMDVQRSRSSRTSISSRTARY